MSQPKLSQLLLLTSVLIAYVLLRSVLIAFSHSDLWFSYIIYFHEIFETNFFPYPFFVRSSWPAVVSSNFTLISLFSSLRFYVFSSALLFQLNRHVMMKFVLIVALQNNEDSSTLCVGLGVQNILFSEVLSS
jgi:hypothetical protein